MLVFRRWRPIELTVDLDRLDQLAPDPGGDGRLMPLVAAVNRLLTETGVGVGCWVCPGLCDAPVADVDLSRLRLPRGSAWPRRFVALNPTELRIELRRRTSSRDAEYLARACRFARVPVRINGKLRSSATEPREAIVSLRFATDAFSGWVGLPRDDELCRTAYLVGEVIHRETVGVSRRGYAHVAAVWADDVPSGAQIPMTAIARAVRGVRADLYRRLPRLWPTLAPGEQRAVRNLLFRLCERSHDPEPLRGLRILARLAGDPVAIETVRATARERTLLAVEVGGAVKTWIADPQQVFCLDERERSLLCELLGLGIVEPPVRAPDSLWGRLGSRHRAAKRALLGMTQRVIGRVFSGRPVDPALLNPAEGAGTYQARHSPARIPSLRMYCRPDLPSMRRDDQPMIYTEDDLRDYSHSHCVSTIPACGIMYRGQPPALVGVVVVLSPRLSAGL